MASLFNKFQEFVKVLAKSPTVAKRFAKKPRELQFEADINRLFLYTSYNRLGRDAEEAEIDEIIEMGGKALFADQEKLVQENVHSQVQNFCTFMDDILLPDHKQLNGPSQEPAKSDSVPRRSGLSFAVGKTGPSSDSPDVPETKPLKLAEVSQQLKELLGYTLEIKPSQIPHEEAGQGLFINGEADAGSVIAFYPGMVYTPAYYRYIPGYPRVDFQNPYLITRYDATVINAKPWGNGGQTREVWNGLAVPGMKQKVGQVEKGSDQVWKMLSKPLDGAPVCSTSNVLERRNPLALAHYANHPAKGMVPNVMVCPYDFPLTEKDMRAYIPNVSFGNADVKMKKFGSFWFKSWKNDSSDVPILKTLVLIATRALCDEEVLLNYRLSNTKRRPTWYTPVDEEEDRRRWS